MQKTVLLADDDVDDFDFFKEALIEADCSATLYRVTDGSGIFKYLDHPENPRPDIIFLDLNMPVMGGWQCLSKLKNTPQLANIPVIIYTTSSHSRDHVIAEDLGAHGVLTKPANPRILTRVLWRIICTLGTDDLYHAISEAYLIAGE